MLPQNDDNVSPIYFAQRPIRWLEAITSTRATASGGPNFAFELCVSQTTAKERASLDLSSWEVAFLGAEPIRAESLQRFAETFEPWGFRRKSFTPCYGMAEGTLLLTAPRERRPPTMYRNGSMFGKRQSTRHQKTASTEHIVGCGSPIADHEIAIVDPEFGSTIAGWPRRRDSGLRSVRRARLLKSSGRDAQHVSCEARRRR